MEREQVFQWLGHKDFDNIIKFLKTGQNTVKEDAILQQAVQYFFNEVLEIIDKPTTEKANFLLVQLFILHTQKFYTFSNEQFESIVVYLAQNSENPEESIFYASKLPNNLICAEIITNHKKSIPKEVVHNQQATIQVHEVITDGDNLTKSIFNSKQEKLFFFALRNCFPNHYIYPNINLSTIINSAIIEAHVSAAEKRFFYNTTIDFVVIDQFNDFKPILAVELDSEWHRSNYQADKDKIKNKLLKIAGLPLYRIEHMNRHKTVEEFEQVILATVKEHRLH
jgi:hypothetical protein